MEPTEEPVDREVVLHDQGRGLDQPPDDDSVGAEQGIRPHGIPSATQFGSLTIRMRTHLWISWGRIAIKHETTAHVVRQEMQQPGADQSALLLQEADASLDGICAAAFALEALSRELVPVGGIPQATVEKWKQQAERPKAKDVALEVLSQTFDTRGVYSNWRDELEWLFEMRGGSVHYEGEFEPPKLHPLGMNVAPAQEAYSAENATRAVDLLLSILERCRDKPKPRARRWSRDMGGAVDELISRRGREHPWP